ncbi:MAG: tetratricopeptide repeat protein [Gammaproteobacteria bacterium]|nr:tetratricopeptide repeat protein [Gammaproteobacteria bacterium]
MEAVKLCQKAEIRFTLAQTLATLGQIERDQEQLDSALSHYEEALNIFREIGDVDRVAHTVRHVGDIHRSSGRFDLAESCYNEALAIYRKNAQTRPLDLANAIRGLAILKSEMNSPDEARQLWEEARKLYETVNVSEGVEECKQRMADLDSS